ncbi:hypothetical protein Pan153_34090 [Gimesia panareensis]|uniref:Uncharacterized protein n=1 Tax=Gimesia panareensis TaxID=2527978 RepID=A0A518FQY3_9PLAN|nr:hypothetical protein Pan153_34090 [Gimesia panareensis]
MRLEFVACGSPAHKLSFYQRENKVSDKPKKKLGVRAFLMLYFILVIIVFAISYFIGGNFH